MSICEIPTCDLVRELEKRNGVDAKYIEPYEDYEVKINGPAIILIVID